jgi:hypothetical protein
MLKKRDQDGTTAAYDAMKPYADAGAGQGPVAQSTDKGTDKESLIRGAAGDHSVKMQGDEEGRWDDDTCVCPRRLRLMRTWCRHKALQAGIRPRTACILATLLLGSLAAVLSYVLTVLPRGGAQPDALFTKPPPVSLNGTSTPAPGLPSGSNSQSQGPGLIALGFRLDGMTADQFGQKQRSMFQRWVARTVGGNATESDVLIKSVVDIVARYATKSRMYLYTMCIISVFFCVGTAFSHVCLII